MPREFSQTERQSIADFCRRHRIRRLAVFGSALRDDFSSASDIDVLVEFERGAHPGLSFFTMGDELADILGHRVDLVTPGAIRPAYRDAILSSARDI